MMRRCAHIMQAVSPDHALADLRQIGFVVVELEERGRDALALQFGACDDPIAQWRSLGSLWFAQPLSSSGSGTAGP